MSTDGHAMVSIFMNATIVIALWSSIDGFVSDVAVNMQRGASYQNILDWSTHHVYPIPLVVSVCAYCSFYTNQQL